MMYFKESPTLQGEKISLRNINPDIDNHQFYNVFLEPDLHLCTGNNIPNNAHETFELLCKYRDLDGKRIVSAEAQRIGKQYWRTGYTKEARKLIYDFVFFELDIEEIHAGAWKDNINSCKSIENIGFMLFNSERKLLIKKN